MPFNQSQIRMIAIETAISTAISAIIPTAIIWIIGVAPPAAMGGSEGLIAAACKGTGIPALMITLVVTQIIRSRVRSGRISGLEKADLAAMTRLLPDNFVLRALFMMIAAIVVVVPAVVILSSVLHWTPLTHAEFAILNFAMGGVVGLIATPLIVGRAFADMRRA